MRLKRSVQGDGHIFAALRAHFAGLPLSAITSRDCRAFQRARLALKTQHGAERNTKTVNREMSALSAVFNYAVDDELLAGNPCRAVRPLKVIHRRPQFWTREQAARALPLMTGERAHLLPLVIVALHTGLSRRDLFQLTIEQCDFDSLMIRRKRAKTGEFIDVPMNSLVATLRESIGQRTDGYVFISPKTGTCFRDCKKSLKQIARLARPAAQFRHVAGTGRSSHQPHSADDGSFQRAIHHVVCASRRQRPAS